MAIMDTISPEDKALTFYELIVKRKEFAAKTVVEALGEYCCFCIFQLVR
jgi:hypothetical protein